MIYTLHLLLEEFSICAPLPLSASAVLCLWLFVCPSAFLCQVQFSNFSRFIGMTGKSDRIRNASPRWGFLPSAFPSSQTRASLLPPALALTFYSSVSAQPPLYWHPFLVPPSHHFTWTDRCALSAALLHFSRLRARTQMDFSFLFKCAGAVCQVYPLLFLAGDMAVCVHVHVHATIKSIMVE